MGRATLGTAGRGDGGSHECETSAERATGAPRGDHPQAHPTDLEVFLEALELEEVGEFEGTDVAPLSADLPLKIGELRRPSGVLRS